MTSITRRALRPFARAAVALALASPSIYGCSRPSEATDRPLSVLIPQDLATLDPRFSTRAFDVKLTRLVHAGLVRLDPDTLEPVPAVAESWRFVDPSTLRVVLRPRLRFHSGRPLEARDVCATLSALNDPALASPHRAVVRAIGQCDVEDERTLLLRLAQPRATLLTDLEVPVLRADQAALPARPDGDLDGLGPYRIERKDGSIVHLVPADTGLDPKPRHALDVQTVHDENARALRLLSGHADVAANAVSPALLPVLQAQAGLHVRARPGANVTYLLLQNDRPPLDRRDVRHALARSLDRAEIVATLLAGRAQVARSLLPPGHWAASDEAAAEPFDPAAARAVLSGLPPITLLVGTDRLRVVIARALAQMLGDAGLSVSVIPLDTGVLFDRLDRGDFFLCTLQIPELTEPHLLAWFFHPRGVPGEGGEGKNRARYRNARFGELLDVAGRERDRATRRTAYVEALQLMADDLPVVPLWHEDQVAVVSDRAEGFVPSAEGRWLGLAGL